MLDDLQVSIVGRVDPMPRVSANKGSFKYPFEELEIGMAMDIANRAAATVRAAVKRWRKLRGRNQRFSVREMPGGAVRVRRDK